MLPTLSNPPVPRYKVFHRWLDEPISKTLSTRGTAGEFSWTTPMPDGDKIKLPLVPVAEIVLFAMLTLLPTRPVA